MNPAEAYIINSEEPFKTILLQLQVLIETTIPEAQLLYKWRIPFYYLNGKQGFVFLNQTKNYVDVGFWHGAHLNLHPEHLVTDGRKHMKSLRYFTQEEIDEKVLIDLLLEAYSVRNRKYYK
ncbi:MAG: DUF1801 domain-containing protein [Bacteroidetes bacterium]|nr:DUF1801 domain-containing protein [Bacteroidota bacterium]